MKTKLIDLFIQKKKTSQIPDVQLMLELPLPLFLKLKKMQNNLKVKHHNTLQINLNLLDLKKNAKIAEKVLWQLKN